MGKRGWLARGVGLTAGITVLVACNALTGVGDLVASNDTLDGGASSGASGTASESGVADGGSDDGRPGDSGGLDPIDATVVDGCSAATCEALPNGFELAAFGADSMAPCPTGFGSPFDGVENPALDPGACTCDCDLASPPTCTVASGQQIGLSFGGTGSGTCTTIGQSVSTGCSTADYLGPFLAFDRKYTAPLGTLTGGNCSASATRNDSKLKTSAVRICQATVIPRCEGKTCVPATGSFGACIAATGDVTCPAAWPTKHLVGSSASFTCGGGCSCSIKGTCSTTGTLSYYASNNCTGAAELTYSVGDCETTSGLARTVGSHNYVPSPPTNPRCEANGTSAPSAPSLANTTTVCCR